VLYIKGVRPEIRERDENVGKSKVSLHDSSRYPNASPLIASFIFRQFREFAKES
jgi:hypothetical protein